MAPTNDDSETAHELDELVGQLHDHLVATAELPIERTANRWLGEAEAVARDAATNDLDVATTTTRVEQVRHLLTEAGELECDTAEDHRRAACELCERILEE